MTEGALPFVMRHGTVIWWIGFAVLTLVLFVVLVQVTRWSALRAERKRAEQGAKHAIIRGTLQGDGAGPLAQTLSVQSRNAASPLDLEPETSVHWRADKLWLDTDQGRVTIDGPVAVIAGSSGSTSEDRVPDEAVPALSANDWVRIAKASVRALKANDQISASGHLEPIASSAASSYRSAKHEWVLRPDAPHTVIRLTAGAIRVHRGAARYLSPFFLTVILIGAFAKLAYMKGETWGRACINDGTTSNAMGTTPLLLSNTHVCSLMMATPGKHEWALSYLPDRVAGEASHDGSWATRMVAIHRYVNQCPAAVEHLLDAGQLESALDVARSCKSARGEYNALVTLGRFDEAAAVVVPTDEFKEDLPSTAVLMLGGKWEAAAHSLDVERERDAKELQDPSEVERHSLWLQCLADYARGQAGDKQAIERVQHAFNTPSGDVCLDELVELSPPEKRRDLLAAARKSATDTGVSFHSALPEDVSAASFEYATYELMRVVADPARYSRDLARIWMWKLKGREPTEATERAWAAVAEVFDGNIVKALELARQAAATPPPSDAAAVYMQADLARLSGYIELYTPSTNVSLSPDTVNAPLLDLRAGRFADAVQLLGVNGPKERAAFAAAAFGDGAALAALMEQGDSIDTRALIAVLPRVTRNRAPLVTAIEQMPQPTQGWSRSPLDALGTIIDRRTLLQLAGLDARAHVWDQVYKRYDEALHDRARLIGLILLGT